MKHYLYKITNVNTNEYYVGVRSHKDPLKDRYMGSSSVWTKEWIKDNREILVKEILDDSFLTRTEAGKAEVILLQECKGDPLCVNKLFDIIPSAQGIKRSAEYLYNRYHGKSSWNKGIPQTEETKKKISETLKGRIISEETREKIRQANIGKFVSEETRQRMSKTKKEKFASGETKRSYKPVMVEDLVTGTVEYFEGCKVFADKYNLNYGSVKVSARLERVYNKRYNIKYVASIGDNSRKLGENGGHPEVDNPVGSLGNE